MSHIGAHIQIDGVKIYTTGTNIDKCPLWSRDDICLHLMRAPPRLRTCCHMTICIVNSLWIVDWVGVRRAGLVCWHNNRIDMSHIGTHIQIKWFKNSKYQKCPLWSRDDICLHLMRAPPRLRTCWHINRYSLWFVVCWLSCVRRAGLVCWHYNRIE